MYPQAQVFALCNTLLIVSLVGAILDPNLADGQGHRAVLEVTD